jgi:NAD-dependent dihydropyrimidine dehydrogenase PreA subunit
MYQTLLAFFMTGTGNSYKVAQWCALAAGDKALATELAQVTAGADSPAIPPNTLTVFTYPTHGFTAPWLMMKYVWRLPPGRKTHAIVLPSRAGIRIKGVFLPGLEGTAGYLIALLLWLKGYSARAVMGVDMPSNWTALHWGLSAENAAVISSLAESKVKSLLTTVLTGHRHYDGIVQFTLGLLLAKISLMYLILAQLILAKLFFAADNCTGCGLCRAICPKQALRLSGKPPRPYWTYACDSCMACMNFCPHRAIEVSPVIIILFYYLTTVPAMAYAFAYIAGTFGLDLAGIPLLGFAIQYLYIIAAIALTYWVLHLSFGSRLLRALAGKLAHTRYYRRYTASGVTPGDLAGKNKTGG